METIKEHLADGENIYLRQFGTFGIITHHKKV